MSPALDPATLSPRRVRLALLALALGGFGIGSSEFVAMGLLPELASDLLPGLSATDPEAADGQAGWIVSAYALGVVVGAPTIAAASARWPRRRLLIVLLAVFTVGSLLSAALPVFPLVLGARFLTGLPHGAYFGIASLVAGSLMGPGNRGRGIALVLSGLTIANVIGVPALTWVGQESGWRSAYLIVAGVFALTIAAVLLTVPEQRAAEGASMRAELSAFRRHQVWLTLGVGAIGFGGLFAVYSYVAPMATEVTGLAAAAVPLILVAMGVGMTIGNLVGGRAADRGIGRSMAVCFLGLLVALILLGLTVGSPVGLVAGVFLVAAASAALSPVVQTRLLDVAPRSQALAAALNHSALNAGNALGAFAGGAVISAGLGYVAPIWVGVGLTVIGMVIAAASFGLESRGRRAAFGPAATPGDAAELCTAPPTGPVARV